MKPTEFVTSDTHFGHAAIVRYSKRPFASVEEMNEGLIQRWNAKVPAKGAVVYHLGDFAFCKPDETRKIVARLNGTIRLVCGNHDRQTKKLDCFDWVRDYYESKCDDGTKVVMCHYGFQVWNKSHYGSWHLHGHSHGSLPGIGKRLDVGVDTNANCEPYSFEEIARIMSKRGVEFTDYHRRETP